MNISEHALSVTAAAWAPSMAADDYGAFLNTLLEAERAGAKLLSAYLDELTPGSSMWNAIREVQLDESRNCSVLIHLLLEAQVMPSTAVGDFYVRGLALQAWRERLQFLNRGQAWVAQRLAAALPRVPQSAQPALQAMLDSHVANIGSCEALL